MRENQNIGDGIYWGNHRCFAGWYITIQSRNDHDVAALYFGILAALHRSTFRIDFTTPKTIRAKRLGLDVGCGHRYFDFYDYNTSRSDTGRIEYRFFRRIGFFSIWVVQFFGILPPWAIAQTKRAPIVMRDIVISK